MPGESAGDGGAVAVLFFAGIERAGNQFRRLPPLFFLIVRSLRNGLFPDFRLVCVFIMVLVHGVLRAVGIGFLQGVRVFLAQHGLCNPLHGLGKRLLILLLPLLYLLIEPSHSRTSSLSGSTVQSLEIISV